MRRFLPILLIVWLACCGFTQGWQKPPLGTQLNRSHSLVQELLYCVPFNENSGEKFNDLSNNYNFTNGLNTKWVSGNILVSTAVSNANRIFQFPTSVLNKTKRNQTISIMVIVKSTSADTRYLFGGGPDNRRYIRIPSTTPTQISFYFDDLEFGATYFPIGIPFIISASINGANAKFYLNGKLSGSSTRTNTTTIGNNIYLGNWNSLNGCWVGLVCGFWFHSRALSGSEIMSLHSKPWDMFTTPIFSQPYLNFGSGGAPPAVIPKKNKTQVLIQVSWWEQMMRNLGVG
jgi:hypothetical protein